MKKHNGLGNWEITLPSDKAIAALRQSEVEKLQGENKGLETALGLAISAAIVVIVPKVCGIFTGWLRKKK